MVAIVINMQAIMGTKEVQVYVATSDIFWYKDNLKGFATTNIYAIEKCYFIDDGAQHMLHLSLVAVLAIVPQSEPSKSVPIDEERQISRDSLPASVNSPSEATATVSPTTAASAIESADPTSTVEFSLGTSVATGDFGSTSGTSIWSTALGGRATFANFRLSASIPYMRVRSNATIFTGIDSTPS